MTSKSKTINIKGAVLTTEKLTEAMESISGMGCDIHMFIEKRQDPSLPWEADEHHVMDPEGWVHSVTAVGRSYWLFNAMAGVRYGDKQLFDARGLPDNVSPIVKQESDRWGIDGHTHSWLTLEEYKTCLEAFDKAIKREQEEYEEDWETLFNDKDFCFYHYSDFDKYEDQPSWASIYYYCKKLIDDMLADNILLGTNYRPEIRLVFWFDN